MIEEDKPKEKDWYNFIWDRSRAIRKELIQQQLKEPEALAMLEGCTRFHIYARYRMRDFCPPDYEQKFNEDHIMACLVSLKDLYSDLHRQGEGSKCKNEAEFLVYRLLYNLSSSVKR